jgi:two-component system cell cycle sensor histidine kinase/response regulator CckA
MVIGPGFEGICDRKYRNLVPKAPPSIGSDVTENKRAEEALRESEEKYRASENRYRRLIEAAPEGISVVEDGRVVFCNDSHLQMLGYSREELIGTRAMSLTTPEDSQEAMESYKARAAGELIPKKTYRLVTKYGKVLWIECVGQRIEWEGRPAVLYFSSDVTEKKKLEEQVAQSQKMEAIGRLAGGIAHDFNNMLQVILGFCSMMKGYLDDRNAIENDLGVIEESAQRAASLTQQLLAFSRKQIVQPTIIDLGTLVQESEKMLSRLLGEDIAFTVIMGEEAGCIRADAAQVQQVIMNLALNARDAMPVGGRITIAIECYTSGSRAVSIFPRETTCGSG